MTPVSIRIAMLAAAALGCATALPAQAQDAKDTLRIAMYATSTTRGHVYGTTFTSPAMFWWEAVYDPFVRIDDKGRPQPMAIEKWEVVNPTTWRVTFKKDITFGSGRTNDAANIVQVFDYLHTDVGKTAGIMRNFAVTSYKAIDSHTVEFVTPKADPLLVPKFGAFYLADMKAFHEMGVEAFSSKPVTSGPYRVVSWNDNEMVAVPNPTSWRRGKVPNLRITSVPEPASRIAALESGQTDIIYFSGPDDIPRIRAAGHIAVIDPAPYVAAVALFTEDFPNKFNRNGKTPLADKRLRQAFNYAVNRESMTKEYLKGITQMSGQPATPSTFGYNPDVKPYPYDPAKAKQLLAEAGYPNGLEVLMETQTGNFVGGSEIVQIVAADLARVGVKVTVQPMIQAEFGNKLRNKKWEGMMSSISMFLAPPMDPAPVFAMYGCGLSFSYTCIEELNPLLAQSGAEMDRAKREVLLKQLMKQSHEEALGLFLFDGVDITGVAKRVKGFKNWNRAVLYEGISIDG